MLRAACISNKLTRPKIWSLAHRKWLVAVTWSAITGYCCVQMRRTYLMLLGESKGRAEPEVIHVS